MTDPQKPYNDLPLLPPNTDLEDPTILKRAIAANRSLAELKGAVLSMPSHNVLINGIVLQEARLSSEIENIVTTNDVLYRAEADEKSAKDPHAKEVLHYREALWHGVNTLKSKPLTTNLFSEIVSLIKKREMTIRKVPGTTIKGSTGTVYTPPEGEAVIRDKLKNLEDFIHAEDDIDPLIKLAIIHYQFEAIHPFHDGNGRTGRIINILYLIEKGLLDFPILFLSRYILRTRPEYYQNLRNVTEKQDWQTWITYILQAIQVTAEETQAQVKQVLEAMDRAKEVVSEKAPKIYSKDLIEVIFSHPYTKISALEEAGIAKREAASRYLKVLEELAILKSEKAGRDMYYINTDLVQILSQ